MWARDEEETFKVKERHVETEKTEESRINSIMERLELITQQINLISNYLMNISQKVSKSIDASVAYQRDLDDLERRIDFLRSRLEEIESIPEVELKRKVGKRAG
ncbi:MAG: hypothetical protein QMD36_02865 [Candidatus Aenigmarchaeota archaeon]|nr:hypothetical protein [Candidatus Aenigmarchaeota archaeon]